MIGAGVFGVRILGRLHGPAGVTRAISHVDCVWPFASGHPYEIGKWKLLTTVIHQLERYVLPKEHILQLHDMHC